MEDMITVVTVTVVNSDGEADCWSDTLGENGDMASLIEEVTENAIERFEDNCDETRPRRIFVQVTHLPRPKSPVTRIEATLPAQEDSDSVVTATVS